MPKHIMRVDKDEKEPQVLSNMRVRYSHISAVILVCWIDAEAWVKVENKKWERAVCTSVVFRGSKSWSRVSKCLLHFGPSLCEQIKERKREIPEEIIIEVMRLFVDPGAIPTWKSVAQRDNCLSSY